MALSAGDGSLEAIPALSGNKSPADDREEVDGSLTASTGNACGVLVPLVP